MIDWKAPQKRLGVTPDGIPGRGTYTALLRVVGPNADAAVIKSLANACTIHFPAYEVDRTVTRLADVIAQTANETGGYRVFVENLNYSSEALVRTWPSRFTPASAATVARKPELIASRVYDGRMGNTRPGDGWAFRGRGMLQLTGRANYEAADRRLGIGLDTNPDLAAVPALSLLIACDFYRTNRVFDALDDGDTDGARRMTNVGNRYAKDAKGKLVKPIGLDHVNAYRAKLLEVLR